MAVNEVLNEIGKRLSGTTALSNVGPVEVMILFRCGVPLLSLSTGQARCLILIVPADLHVGVAGRRISAPVQEACSSVNVVGSFGNELGVDIVGEDTSFTSFTIESLVVPVSTGLVENSGRACHYEKCQRTGTVHSYCN